MEITVSVLLLSSTRLQVLSDLSPVTWAHYSVQICGGKKNPPNLIFPINHKVCKAKKKDFLKYKTLFVKSPFDSLPLVVLIEIFMNERILCLEFASRQFSLGLGEE